MRARSMAVLAAATAVAASSWADDRLVGTWKLASYHTEFQDGSPTRKVFGENPKGFLVYTAQGRQMVLIEAEGRKPPTNDQERAALLQSAISWSGVYRLEGNKHILKVDAALNPALVGTERVSELKIEGDRMFSISPWAPSPTVPGSPLVRGVTVWERIK
jgi:hypothetical protein